MKLVNKSAIKDFKTQMNLKYASRDDRDNIFGVGLTDSEFRNFIINIFLGKDWYVVDPISHDQVNEQALYQILDKVDKKWDKVKLEDLTIKQIINIMDKSKMKCNNCPLYKAPCECYNYCEASEFKKDEIKKKYKAKVKLNN